ncbi:B-cell receptor CD22-like [Rhinichthys klamathensis goyatoka]|uniref:B-cell receptor CD22-like n=1 Tax=Rhinichthys klamathensis goyatoka TaxID=3034132 RepID=UPI0024B51168|nr:B-cell receptor CD22-like [Rhinichthys klamathensis goyatoka]
MRCTYTYPTGYQIKEVFWSNTKDKKKDEVFPDLSKDTEYSQRLQYLGDKQQNCTVRLSHVTLKDSHMYYFRFITDKEKWIGKSGVNLTVTDLQVESPERVTEGDSVSLTCKSSCALTDRATFIWYRNSQPLTERRDRNNELLLQSVRREDSGRYSCAVDGHTPVSPDVQLNDDDPGSYAALDLKSRSSDLYDTLTTVHPRPDVHQSDSSEYENLSISGRSSGLHITNKEGNVLMTSQ